MSWYGCVWRCLTQDLLPLGRPIDQPTPAKWMRLRYVTEKLEDRTASKSSAKSGSLMRSMSKGWKVTKSIQTK